MLHHATTAKNKIKKTRTDKKSNKSVKNELF